jgi:hypothetical protein
MKVEEHMKQYIQDLRERLELEQALLDERERLLWHINTYGNANSIKPSYSNDLVAEYAEVITFTKGA